MDHNMKSDAIEEDNQGEDMWSNNMAADKKNNKRVQFNDDITIKEFHRKRNEFEEIAWHRGEAMCGGAPKYYMFMGMTTCLFAVAVSVVLPWYIIANPINK